MARSRRESHHSDGITEPAKLQRASATKSAQSGHPDTLNQCPLLGVKRTLPTADGYPCFAMRFGGVSGDRESQGWRDSSHTPIVGAGKFGSAKLPMATATYPGKPSPSQ